MVWSPVYAAVGGYWAVSGRGFPYPPELASDVAGPVAGRFGPAVAWILVITAGLPAAAAGTAMLRGARVLRPFLIAAGGVIAWGLLLMTDIDLLITPAYVPFIVFRLLTGTEIDSYVQALGQWTLIHQWLCLIGGYFWLAAPDRGRAIHSTRKDLAWPCGRGRVRLLWPHSIFRRLGRSGRPGQQFAEAVPATRRRRSIAMSSGDALVKAPSASNPEVTPMSSAAGRMLTQLVGSRLGRSQLPPNNRTLLAGIPSRRLRGPLQPIPRRTAGQLTSTCPSTTDTNSILRAAGWNARLRGSGSRVRAPRIQIQRTLALRGFNRWDSG